MAEYRSQLSVEDVERITAVTQATGFFSAEEVAIARELTTENVTKGELLSEYYFLVLDSPQGVDAFACYGPIPGTVGSFDLYWIVVSPSLQGRGAGRSLIQATVARVVAAGGKRLYADTSSRAQYAPTRAFYERCGFSQVALLDDYYDRGDGKVIYLRRLV